MLCDPTLESWQTPPRNGLRCLLCILSFETSFARQFRRVRKAIFINCVQHLDILPNIQPLLQAIYLCGDIVSLLFHL